MADTKPNPNEKVTLVALDVFPPYKKGDIFTVTRKEADAVLTSSPRENEFGVAYPTVKVREYKPEEDEHLLAQSGTLNQKDQGKLEDKLYGEPAEQKTLESAETTDKPTVTKQR